jgi:hypothetical protein
MRSLGSAYLHLCQSTDSSARLRLTVIAKPPSFRLRQALTGKGVCAQIRDTPACPVLHSRGGIGVEGVPSTLATAIRAVVIGVIAWVTVLATGEQHALPRESCFRRAVTSALVLSGVLRVIGD